jgi:hypothetical protein
MRQEGEGIEATVNKASSATVDNKFETVRVRLRGRPEDKDKQVLRISVLTELIKLLARQAKLGKLTGTEQAQ